MSGHLAASNRPHLGLENLLAANDREKAQAADTSIDYSGNYEQWGDRMIHHMAVSFFPNWTGGEQIRVADLDGDWLTLRGTSAQLKGVFITPTLRWKRLGWSS
jgi:Lipocalin-like domain